MKSSTTAMICVMGVFLISLLGLSQADVDPGETAQEDIRNIIKEGVNSDSITFWELIDNVLQEKITLSKDRVCTKITNVHNDFNAEFLGDLTIERDECLRAFLRPLKYNADRLNFWAGTHCGDWSTLTALLPFQQDEVVPDNAEWDIAPQPPPQTSTQDVTYVNRGPPPGAFNRVDGTSYIRGYDPKDIVDYQGYQGTYVGYAFTSQTGSASCIVKVTRTEAFLECIKTVNGVKKRTSAGFYNFGQWTVQDPGSQCP